MKKVFLVSLIASLSVSALVAILIFLIGNFGETEARLLFTTLSIGGYSITGLCSAALYDKRKYTGFALLGIVIAVIGFLVTVGGIWEIIDFDTTWKAVAVCAILSLSIAHASLLLLAKSENGLVKSLLYATIVFIVVVAGMLIHLIVLDFNAVGEYYYRLLGVFAVVDVLGTILVPILRRINLD